MYDSAPHLAPRARVGKWPCIDSLVMRLRIKLPMTYVLQLKLHFFMRQLSFHLEPWELLLKCYISTYGGMVV